MINEGYYTVDISDTFMKQGKDDEWFGWFILKKDGEKMLKFDGLSEIGIKDQHLHQRYR